ncbi:hypothetical protein [Celeribacter arenosi]|uniref:YCII-related domain-containing protein n=1 Tax=Celeribacter arenosi TaxID=792649 RepID=A0ABP7K4B9_9RHOB
MSKFVLIFRGGAPSSQEEGEKMMVDWTAWLGGMGDAVLDAGEAVGTSQFIGAKSDPVSGYMKIDAADMDAAMAHAQKCPILTLGGSIEIAPALEM